MWFVVNDNVARGSRSTRVLEAQPIQGPHLELEVYKLRYFHFPLTAYSPVIVRVGTIPGIHRGKWKFFGRVPVTVHMKN